MIRETIAYTLALTLALGAMPSVVHAEPSGEVDAINAQAVDKFKNKEYDEAVALFERAYELSPEPNYLFNIGRIYEEKGDLENSVKFYERFVKEPAVPLEARERGLERLRVLRAIIEETKPEQPPPVEPPPPEDDPEPEETSEPQTETEPDPVPPVVEEEPKRKTPGLRIAGYVVLGVGGAALATGGAMAGLAFQRSNLLEEQHTFEQRDATATQGRAMALSADILFAAGGALATAGLVMVIVSLKRGSKASDTTASRARVSPWASRRGGGMAATVRF
ncbi:MAG: tetratricopeptide repeat protein [Deltaproteobacteria bacterium]|nr:tetratricopeptide repeat protein [Deltaproteobacteria bacterium]